LGTDKPTIAEQPTVFPDWLRRLDPTLASAPDNALYQAFRLRRSSGLAGIGRLLRDRRFMIAILATALGIVTIAGLILFWGERVLASPLAMLAVFGFLMVVIFFCGIGMRSGNRSGLMPRSLREVFSQGGVRYFPLLDVHMTGNSPREIIEAMYLENREAQCAISQFMFCMLAFGLPLTIWYGAQLSFGRIPFFSLQMLILLTMAFLFAHTVRKLIGVIGMESALFDVRRIRMASFTGQRMKFGGLRTAIKRLFETGVMMFIMLAILTSTITMLLMMSDMITGKIPTDWIIPTLISLALGTWTVILWILGMIGKPIVRRLVKSGIELATMDYEDNILDILAKVPDR